MAKATMRTSTKVQAAESISHQLRFALAALEAKSTAKDLANLARFAITAYKPFGVSMSNMKQIAKQLGKSHELALALWKTHRYEARMLATLVDEPDRVTPAQMDRWCRDFDNWAICDTACFCLFDRTPHAWKMIGKWCHREPEFEKRTAFALLWSLSVHDQAATDKQFLDGLSAIEQSATDERNFVKKAVNMALRAIGKRNAVLHAAATKVSVRLAASTDATARWIGQHALRELQSRRPREAYSETSTFARLST